MWIGNDASRAEMKVDCTVDSLVLSGVEIGQSAEYRQSLVTLPKGARIGSLKVSDELRLPRLRGSADRRTLLFELWGTVGTELWGQTLMKSGLGLSQGPKRSASNNRTEVCQTTEQKCVK